MIQNDKKKTKWNRCTNLTRKIMKTFFSQSKLGNRKYGQIICLPVSLPVSNPKLMPRLLGRSSLGFLLYKTESFGTNNHLSFKY